MMRYKLVIAEKPSVAQSLAAVIGATARKDGYLEGNGWRVSWCVGHLAGLADADSYDPKYANDGRVRVTGLYSEKTGKTYDAAVVLEDDGQYANFKLEFDQRKGGSR